VADLEEMMLSSSRVYNTLFEQRILFLKGAVEEANSDALVAQMLAMDAQSQDDITLYINSPGGIITGLFAIFDTMHSIESKVNTKCVGLAASAAAVILAAGTGNRSATENSRIMIHQPLGGARGTARDIEIQAKNIVFLRERLNEILAERCGKSVEEVATDTDRDHWLTAAEAVAYGTRGLIDEVVNRVHYPVG
jgi:ATP-dependent Clp protease protease subunit